MVHTINVSIMVPSMATSPCSTGSFVFAAACAMGALPNPASLEKMPRATPNRIAAHTVAPAKPPAAEAPLKALSTMVANAAGTSEIFISMTIKLMMMYEIAIAGTTAPAVSAIRLMPPRITAPTMSMRTRPVIHQGTPALSVRTWATEFD